MIVVPVLKELRDQMEGVRAAELERALRRLRHLNPDDRAQLDHFSHTLLNKFLHQPTIALKEAARAGREYGLVEALKRLFGLERREKHEIGSLSLAWDHRVLVGVPVAAPLLGRGVPVRG